MRPIAIAGLVVGISLLSTALLAGLVFLCIALLGEVAGGITSLVLVLVGLFAVIWWVEAR